MRANIKSINPHFNGLLGFTLVTVCSLKHSHRISLLITDVKRFLEGFPFFTNYEVGFFFFLKGFSAFEIARLFGWGHCWLPAVSLADKAVCFVALKTAIFYIMTCGVLDGGGGGGVTGGFSINAGNLSLIFFSHLLKSKGTEARARFILTFPLVLRAADRIRLCALSSGMGQ